MQLTNFKIHKLLTDVIAKFHFVNLFFFKCPLLIEMTMNIKPHELLSRQNREITSTSKGLREVYGGIELATVLVV